MIKPINIGRRVIAVSFVKMAQIEKNAPITPIHTFSSRQYLITKYIDPSIKTSTKMVKFRLMYPIIEKCTFEIIIINNEIERRKPIDIIFLTHSPYILSDIPNTEIIRLKRGKVEEMKV